MPPLPKKKHSKGRKGSRNAHAALKPRGVATCPQCNESKLPHRVCPKCGYYNGREVISSDSETET